jgi:hypothetical protein
MGCQTGKTGDCKNPNFNQPSASLRVTQWPPPLAARVTTLDY